MTGGKTMSATTQTAKPQAAKAAAPTRSASMTERVFNFSPGPAVLPVPVLEQVQREMLALPGAGMSILEISHRSKAFDAILAEATQGIRDLLGVPEGYHVLFMQGGASLQFYMLAMNLLRGSGKAADYLLTGTWGKKAIDEAKREWHGMVSRPIIITCQRRTN
jgi:phosphoserine aminotransferase